VGLCRHLTAASIRDPLCVGVPSADLQYQMLLQDLGILSRLEDAIRSLDLEETVTREQT